LEARIAEMICSRMWCVVEDRCIDEVTRVRRGGCRAPASAAVVVEVRVRPAYTRTLWFVSDGSMRSSTTGSIAGENTSVGRDRRPRGAGEDVHAALVGWRQTGGEGDCVNERRADDGGLNVLTVIGGEVTRLGRHGG
jgi:hypothetical protein